MGIRKRIWNAEKSRVKNHNKRRKKWLLGIAAYFFAMIIFFSLSSMLPQVEKTATDKFIGFLIVFPVMLVLGYFIYPFIIKLLVNRGFTKQENIRRKAQLSRMKLKNGPGKGK
jgi:cation transport ATPase